MVINTEITEPKKVDKSWGYELLVHNDEEYCGKLLVFEKAGSHFSMHYHLKKKETWYIQEGAFHFHWIDVEDGQLKKASLTKGQSVVIERGLPHQLTSLENNSIMFEVSTEHFDEDSYRIYKNTPEDLL